MPTSPTRKRRRTSRGPGSIPISPAAVAPEPFAEDSWPGDLSREIPAAPDLVSPPASVLRASVHGKFDTNTEPLPDPTPPAYAGDISNPGEWGLEGRIDAELGAGANTEDERPTLELEVRQDGEQVVLSSPAPDDPDREARDAPEPVAGTLEPAVDVRGDLPAADESGMWPHPRAPWEYDEYPDEGAANQESSPGFKWAAIAILALAAVAFGYSLLGPGPGEETKNKATTSADGGKTPAKQDDGGKSNAPDGDDGELPAEDGTPDDGKLDDGSLQDDGAVPADGGTPDDGADGLDGGDAAEGDGASDGPDDAAADDAPADEGADEGADGGEPSPPDPRVAEAERLYKYERYDDARKQVDDILASDPENARALLLRSNMLIDESKFDEALQAARASVRSDPDIAEGHLAVGLILYEQDEAAQAVDAYRKYLELAPDGLYSQWTRKQVKRLERKLGIATDG